MMLFFIYILENHGNQKQSFLLFIWTQSPDQICKTTNLLNEFQKYGIS